MAHLGQSEDLADAALGSVRHAKHLRLDAVVTSTPHHAVT
jgi:hypothetical protein